jgi:hypothetical protein
MTQDNTIITSSTNPRYYHVILVLIILVTIGIRLSAINRTVRLDEARSMHDYAQSLPSEFLFDFSDTNNHFFNTLIMHIQYRLLGNDEDWKIRVHVLVVGTLVTIATYYVGKELYDADVGIMASALSSVMYLLVEFSINARGYIIIVLIYLLMIILINRLITRASWLGWLTIGILSALGFFVSPIFLYSMGTLGLWMVLSIWFKNTGQHRRRVFVCFVGAMILGAILTVSFYAVVVTSSYTSTTQLSQSNIVRYTTAYPSNYFFTNTLPTALKTLFDIGHTGMSFPIIIMCVVGAFYAIVTQHKISMTHASLPLAIVLWLSLQIVIQRTFILERTFTFLMPIYAIWIAVGWLNLSQMITKRHISRLPTVIIMSSLIMSSVGYQIVTQGTMFTSILTGSMPYGRYAVNKIPGLLEPEEPLYLQGRFIEVLDYYYRRDGIDVAMLPLKTWIDGSFIDNLDAGKSLYFLDEHNVRIAPFLEVHEIEMPDQNLVLEPIKPVTDYYFLYKLKRIPPTLKEITNVEQVDTFWFANQQKVSFTVDDTQTLTFDMYADDWKLFRYRYGRHWQDYQLSLRVNITETSDEYEELRIHFREAGGSSYLFELNVAADGLIGFRLDEGESSSNFLTSAPYAIELNNWYNIMVEAHGDRLTAFIDGEQVLEVNDATLSHGTIAFLASPDAKVQITDIRIEQYD